MNLQVGPYAPPSSLAREESIWAMNLFATFGAEFRLEDKSYYIAKL